MQISLLDRWHLQPLRDPHPFRSYQRKQFTLSGALRLFAFLGGSAFILASIGYFLLWMIMPDGWVFGAVYRMFLYHWQHPLPYIAVMALCFAIVGTTVIIFPGDPFRRWPRLTTLLIIVLSIVVASPAGGALWMIHHMQESDYTRADQFWENIRWGAKEGILTGWLVILLSFPYNILGLVLGHLVTRLGYGMTLVVPPSPGKLQTLAESGACLPVKHAR